MRSFPVASVASGAPCPASHPGTLARNPPCALQGAPFLRKTRTCISRAFDCRMCRLRTCVLCEEARFPPCSAGGTRARPRITRRWHRATAERQGGLQNGKSSSRHHAGQEPGTLPPLERRPRHGRALAQVLRASGLPSSEPGLLRMGADGPGGRELLRRVALGGHRPVPKPWRPGRQRRIRHRRLEDSRSLRHGLRRGLERTVSLAHRPFRRAEWIRLRRDASRLR